MKISNISIPEVYKSESFDFRFFLKWIEESFQKIKYDHENAIDLYDPLRCPMQLLWMLADTMGYKYDDRLPPSFCRLVLTYFMSMIKLKGSKNGVMLAAEVNLAQFNLLNYGKEKEILYNRLEDTSIPVNSVSVIPHVDEGYIEVVYFSDRKPIDACIEYVRPLGMYLFPKAGVVIHARTKIWVDGLLTNQNDMNLSVGPTHIGHYSREDYARLQKMKQEHEDNSQQSHKNVVNTSHRRKPVWYRNDKYDKYRGRNGYTITPDSSAMNPGYRSLYSLQMSNNEHIVESLLPPMFSLGYGPHPNDPKLKQYIIELIKSIISDITSKYIDKLINSYKNIIESVIMNNIYVCIQKHIQNCKQAIIDSTNKWILEYDKQDNIKYKEKIYNEINPIINNYKVQIINEITAMLRSYSSIYSEEYIQSNCQSIQQILIEYLDEIYMYLSNVIDNYKDISYEYYINNKDVSSDRPWDLKNMRYVDNDNAFGDGWSGLDLINRNKDHNNIRPEPRINPILANIGDAIAMDPHPLERTGPDAYKNSEYTKSNDPTNAGKKIHIYKQEDV